jgi:Arc/MetJ-type ribon-helix-helix transcriptional regulator
MASSSKNNSSPLTFDLPLELIAKIKLARKSRGLQSASEVVRLAIEQFDFEACSPAQQPHRQISVRVAASQRAMLKRYARSKDTSVGELLRLALEGLAVRAPRAARRS